MAYTHQTRPTNDILNPRFMQRDGKECKVAMTISLDKACTYGMFNGPEKTDFILRV